MPLPLLRGRRRHGPALDHVVARAVRRDRTVATSTPATTREPAIVLNQLRDKVSDVGAMRALGFCVSVAHAEYMADVFNAGRHPRSRRQRSDTPSRTRPARSTDLRARRVNILFAADLFNEGLDIPDVDTVLFLRPTESATVFLQQLGRGLRRTRDKAVLTVLDFVGYHRKEFRFDQKLRALTGPPARASNVRSRRLPVPAVRLLRSRWTVSPRRWSSRTSALRSPTVGSRSSAELRSYGDSDLGGLPRGVRHRAQRHPAPRKPLLDPAAPRRRLAHRARLRAGGAAAQARPRLRPRRRSRTRAAPTRRLLRRRRPAVRRDAQPAEQRLARMLFYSLWSDGGGHESYADGLAALRRRGGHTAGDLGGRRHLLRRGAPRRRRPRRSTRARSRCGCTPATSAKRSWRRSTSLGTRTASARASGTPRTSTSTPSSSRSRSPRPTTPPPRCTATTRSVPTLFHWESQSTTSVGSPTGQRYLTGSSTVLIFARQEQKDEFGTSPVPLPRAGHYVSPHRRPADRDHVAAGARDADRLLHGRLGDSSITPARSRGTFRHHPG